MSIKETENKRSDFKVGDRVYLRTDNGIQQGTVILESAGLSVFFDGDDEWTSGLYNDDFTDSTDIFDHVHPMPVGMPYEEWSVDLFADDEPEPDDSLDDLRHDLHRTQHSLSIRITLMIEAREILSDAAVYLGRMMNTHFTPDGNVDFDDIAQVFHYVDNARIKLNRDPEMDDIPF